jgi:hypothetical protein
VERRQAAVIAVQEAAAVVLGRQAVVRLRPLEATALVAQAIKEKALRQGEAGEEMKEWAS